MTRATNYLRVAAAALFVMLVSAPAFAQHRGGTIVYHVQRSEFCWLQKAPLNDAEIDRIRSGALAKTIWCPAPNHWTPPRDYFRAGTVVELVITRGRFLSTYEATVNATVVRAVGPYIRGIDDAETLTPPKGAEDEPEKKGAISSQLLQNAATVGDEAEALLKQLRTEHGQAMANGRTARTLLQGLLGPAPVGTPGVPSLRVRTLAAFATALAGRSATAISGAPPYTDERAFTEMTRLADETAATVAQLNERLRARQGDVTTAFAALEGYLDTATVAQDRVTRAKGIPAALLKELQGYLPNGASFNEAQALLAELSKLRTELETLAASLNDSLLSTFENLNAMYGGSESTTPFSLLLGQWTSNQSVTISVKELPGFRRYGFADEVGSLRRSPPPAQGSAGGTAISPTVLGEPEAKGGTGGAAEKKKEAGEGDTPTEKPPSTTPPATPPSRTLIAQKAFTVHQFARASVTSGFVFSRMKTNTFGIEQVRAVDDEGKPRSAEGAPVFDRTPVISETTRFQSHYYVGLLYYFRERDLYPDAGRKGEVGLLIGYGVNEPLNFFLGLAGETKWGVSGAVGWHLGREKILAPGLVALTDPRDPRPYTRLADSVTAVPTETRAANALFGSVGFDLRVFAKVFGGATGTVKGN